MVQTTKFLIVEPSPPPFSSLLGPNIRLRILFSNTLTPRSSLNVTDHASQPYSTTDNIIVLYVLPFTITELNYGEGTVTLEKQYYTILNYCICIISYFYYF